MRYFVLFPGIFFTIFNTIAFDQISPPDSLWFSDSTLYWSEVDNAIQYKIYRGRESGKYGFPFSTTTKFIKFDDLINNIIYYFAVTSVDSDLNESIKSIEILSINDTFDIYKVYLKWLPNSEPDLAGYKIYWGTETKNYSNIKDVGKVIEDTLTGFFKDIKYYFAVTAYDSADNESDYSDEVSIILSITGNFKKGDCNEDCQIDIKDLILLKSAFGANKLESNYKICFDFDENGDIFIYDLIKFKKVFGLIYGMMK